MGSFVAPESEFSFHYRSAQGPALWIQWAVSQCRQCEALSLWYYATIQDARISGIWQLVF